MRNATAIAALLVLFTLGACSTVGDTMKTKAKAEAPAAISTIDCFSAGGTIDNASGKSMCKMNDGSTKPVL